jgi:hypothetical protein
MTTGRINQVPNTSLPRRPHATAQSATTQSPRSVGAPPPRRGRPEDRLWHREGARPHTRHRPAPEPPRRTARTPGTIQLPPQRFPKGSIRRRTPPETAESGTDGLRHTPPRRRMPPADNAGKRRLPQTTSPQEYAEDHWHDANNSTDPIHAGDAELVPGQRPRPGATARNRG